MSIFDKLKKKNTQEKASVKKGKVSSAPKKKVESKKATTSVTKKPATIRNSVNKIKYADIVLKPLITEKAGIMASQNKYAFSVKNSANKIDIATAIEAVYNIKPVRVNIINVSGKSVRYGRSQGKTKGWKKAVVTLPQGQSIQIHEGV